MSGEPAAADGVCGDCGLAGGGWANNSGAYFCAPCWSRWADWYDSRGLPRPSPAASRDAMPDHWPKRLRRAAAAGAVTPSRRFLVGAGAWRKGCPCDEDGSDKFCWELWEELASKDEGVDHMEFCDSHCHLDYLLLNEKHGIEWIRKKKMCYRWESGDCWFGEFCDFAHGPEDLTQRQPLETPDVEAFARRHLGPHLVAGARPATRHEEQVAQPEEQAGATPQAVASECSCLITNCCDEDAIGDTQLMLECAERVLRGVVYVTFGCHPHNYRDYSDAYEQRLLDALAAAGSRAVGWGECGLDYHKNFWDVSVPAMRAQMLEVFSRQARIAVARNLPLVVHSRDAEEDTMSVLRECVPRDYPVHIHAFQGSEQMLVEILDTMPGAMVGISGQIAMTWSAHCEGLSRRIPLERLLLETDAPFLSGKPRAIPHIAACVARARGGCSAEEVLRAANANCRRFYRLPAAAARAPCGAELPA